MATQTFSAHKLSVKRLSKKNQHHSQIDHNKVINFQTFSLCAATGFKPSQCSILLLVHHPVSLHFVVCIHCVSVLSGFLFYAIFLGFSSSLTEPCDAVQKETYFNEFDF